MSGDRGVEDAIRRILVERLELPAQGPELSSTSDLRQSAGVDSAALLELVVAIEEEFALAVDAEDVTEANFRTIGGIARFVQARKKAAGEAAAC